MSRYIRDPGIPLIKVPKGKGGGLHSSSVALIAALLKATGFKVNYDHVVTSVPKTRTIPLFIRTRKGTHKADIAFWIREDTLVHVEVNVYKRKDIVKVLENGKG